MISITVIIIVLLYILIYRFFVFAKVKSCKQDFHHIPEIKSEIETDYVSCYNPSVTTHNGKKATSLKISTNGTMYYHMDTILNMNKIKLNDEYIDAFYNDKSVKDIRIFSISQRLYGLGSINEDNTIKPIIILFSEDLKGIEKIHYLTSDDTIKNIPAKNWILIERGEEILVQTDIYPEFIIQKLDRQNLLNFKNLHLTSYIKTDTNIEKILNITDEKLGVRKLHGTSNWIRLNNGNFLSIVHSFYQASQYVKYARRIYRNMFVEIDYNKLNIVRFSNFVCFSEMCNCIQFATSLYKEDDIITVGLGIDDHYTRFVKYKENEIIKSLIHN